MFVLQFVCCLGQLFDFSPEIDVSNGCATQQSTADRYSESARTSVAIFAHNLGHQCLNEVMAALLAGREIADHMAEYRADHIDRYERVRKSGDIDALFVDREEASVHDED